VYLKIKYLDIILDSLNHSLMKIRDTSYPTYEFKRQRLAEMKEVIKYLKKSGV